MVVCGIRADGRPPTFPSFRRANPGHQHQVGWRRCGRAPPRSGPVSLILVEGPPKTIVKPTIWWNTPNPPFEIGDHFRVSSRKRWQVAPISFTPGTEDDVGRQILRRLWKMSMASPFDGAGPLNARRCIALVSIGHWSDSTFQETGRGDGHFVIRWASAAGSAPPSATAPRRPRVGAAPLAESRREQGSASSRRYSN